MADDHFDRATAAFLHEAYDRMRARFGATGWWPGDTPFEIAVGAILTQNTAWTNVERAIANMKRAKLLSPKAVAEADVEDLEQAIRPSGYFRQKAKRLRIFAEHLRAHYGGSVKRLARRPAAELREELLAL